MHVKGFLLLLISISIFSRSKAQLGKFSVGLNAKVGVLTSIQAKDIVGFTDSYGGAPKEFILNVPVTFRYTTNSFISLRYQIELSQEMIDLFKISRDSYYRIGSNCRYLINTAH